MGLVLNLVKGDEDAARELLYSPSPSLLRKVGTDYPALAATACLVLHGTVVYREQLPRTVLTRPREGSGLYLLRTDSLRPDGYLMLGPLLDWSSLADEFVEMSLTRANFDEFQRRLALEKADALNSSIINSVPPRPAPKLIWERPENGLSVEKWAGWSDSSMGFGRPWPRLGSWLHYCAEMRATQRVNVHLLEPLAEAVERGFIGAESQIAQWYMWTSHAVRQSQHSWVDAQLQSHTYLSAGEGAEPLRRLLEGAAVGVVELLTEEEHMAMSAWLSSNGASAPLTYMQDSEMGVEFYAEEAGLSSALPALAGLLTGNLF